MTNVTNKLTTGQRSEKDQQAVFIARRGKRHCRFATRQEALAFVRANPIPGQPWDIRAFGEAAPPRPVRGVQEAFVDASKARLLGRSGGGWC